MTVPSKLAQLIGEVGHQLTPLALGLLFAFFAWLSASALTCCPGTAAGWIEAAVLVLLIVAGAAAYWSKRTNWAPITKFARTWSIVWIVSLAGTLVAGWEVQACAAGLAPYSIVEVEMSGRQLVEGKAQLAALLESLGPDTGLILAYGCLLSASLVLTQRLVNGSRDNDFWRGHLLSGLIPAVVVACLSDVTENVSLHRQDWFWAREWARLKFSLLLTVGAAGLTAILLHTFARKVPPVDQPSYAPIWCMAGKKR